MSKTIDDKTKFIELRAKGYSFSKISVETGISKPKLLEWSKELSTSVEISNCKNLLLDEFREKYILDKKNRVKLFGLLLNDISKELKTRDYSSIPTDKLILIAIKISDKLEAEDLETLEIKSVESCFDTFSALVANSSRI